MDKQVVIDVLTQMLSSIKKSGISPEGQIEQFAYDLEYQEKLKQIYCQALEKAIYLLEENC